jgi:hypothetical protein
MTIFLPLTDDQLVSELWARDVQFLMGRQTTPAPLLDPAHLIASLAQSEDARVRLSLIPLFLRHPEFSADVKTADKSLSLQTDQLVLRFYYTAAILLQRKYWERIINIFGKQIQLPDLFSGKLGLSPDQDPDQTLVQLGKHHHLLSGQIINWIGMYEHGADVWLKEMELQKA